MPDYYAVIKRIGVKVPEKLVFTAVGTMEAIDEMIRGAGVSSTADFEEFEILRVEENGNAYIPVSAKLPRRERGALRSTPLITSIDDDDIPVYKVVPAPTASVMVESEYLPYFLEEA